MLELLQIFVDNIAPILIIAGVGYALGRSVQPDPRSISAVIFNVLSPSLVFYSLYDSDIGGGEIVTLFGGVIVLQTTMLGIAMAVMWMGSDIQPRQRANVLLATMSMNTGNYGLSLVAFAFGDAALSRAAVIFVANSMMNYTLGVYVASNGTTSPLQAVAAVLRTPAVYALIAALVFSALNFRLPLMVERPIVTLSGAAIPMMLLLLGLQLAQFKPVARSGRLLMTGVGLRMLVSPFIAAGITLLLGMTGDARTAFIVQGAMPTAVITLVLSTQFRLDRDLMLAFIFVSTLVSPFTLSVLVAILR